MSTYFVRIILLILVISFSCKKKKTTSATECQVVDNVSFNKDIVPIFEAHCVSCHSGNNASGNLNLESSVAYSNLIDIKSGYIDTIEPTYSLLYASMISTTNPMPKNGKLDKCTTDLILKWIQQKADNN
jgi:cytochrome c5